MKLPRLALIAAVLSAGLPATVSRAALWVSPEGDDRNPGTEEQPLRTIAGARDAVRSLNRGMSDDITVFIAGTHRLAAPLEFGPADSGTNGFSIVYTAAPGEHPVFTGAFRIGGWQVADRTRNLWSAPAPAGLEDAGDLYVNGSHASRTRARLLQALSREAPGTAAADPRAQWRNPSDVVFVSPGPDALWSERIGAPPFFAENAFELLGRPGEWYLDRAARRIYYTPRQGEELATADVEAAAAGALIVGQGTAERPLTGLVFKGIRFEYASRPGASPAGIAPGAAVRFANAAGIQFLEDDFIHLATPALDLGPGIDGATVEGCIFGDISWTALRIRRASRARVSDSRFSYVSTEHPEGAVVEISGSTDTSVEYSQCDHFPSAAIVEDGAAPAGEAVIAADVISAALIADDRGIRARVVPGAGITGPYRSLLEERLFPPAPPHPPTDVSANPEDEEAYVTWDPPCLDGGSPVGSFVVSASTGATMAVSAADFRSRGYVVFTGLENGARVSFSVAAVNATGTGVPSLASAPIVPSHKRKLKTPTPPTSISFSVAPAGTTVRLAPPSSNGGSPVVSYAIAPPPPASPVVLQGRDVIRADASHPLVRMIAGFYPTPEVPIAVTATNIRGEGQAAVVKYHESASAR